MNKRMVGEFKGVTEDLEFWIARLYDVLELNKGVVKGSSSWLAYSEALLQKSAMQSLTVLYLCHGTKPDVQEIDATVNFIDNFSIQTIVRSVWESYLVFYYVFLDTEVGLRVKKLRYKLWRASSLLNRQRYVFRTDKVRVALKAERSEYLKLRREVLRSRTYLTNVRCELRDKDAKNFEKGKSFDWKPEGGWRRIAKLALDSEDYWNDIYKVFSSSTHSNEEIVHQLNPNFDMLVVQMTQAGVAVESLNFLIPLFIEGYAKLFPRLDPYLRKYGISQHAKLNIERVFTRWRENL